MKYLSFYTPKNPLNEPPPPDKQAAMMKFMEESFKNGSLIATGALLPTEQGGMRVRKEGDKFSVIDGPYSEAKEVVIGWALLHADSKEKILNITKAFMNVAGGEGECHLRQVAEGPAPEHK